MMATRISLFPVLTEELRTKIRFQMSEYELYYTKDEIKFSLQSEEIDNNPAERKIIDKKGIWTPDHYNLCIRRKFSAITYHYLFGEDGVVCRNSVLGIAVRWTSQDSRQRGVIKIGSLFNSAESKEFILDYEFPPAKLRGAFELTTVLYLEQPGTPVAGEEHLTNICGCIIGELDKITLRLDGIGSEFPIYEIDKPSWPLWSIKCEWTDPSIDQFIECISLYINKAHKGFKYIEKDEQLMKEIMSSALFLLITKLKSQKDDWDAAMEGKDLLEGSVSAAVNYFIKTLGWDTSTPESLSVSIRIFLDRRM